MDLFLLFPANPNDPVQEDDDNNSSTCGYSSRHPDEPPDNHNISDDDYLTPRTESSLATPRSLFSTPPRSPPRPTSNVDTRIRMRRYKLSLSPGMTPTSSPRKSNFADCSSSDAGPSSSSATTTTSPIGVTTTALFDDGHEANKNASSPFTTPPHSPYSTPNSSPTKSELEGLSPLQKRLARARTKRERIMEERAQTIDVKIKTKEMEAIKRKEDATLEKVTKARTEDSILQAKERREQLEIDKQLHMLCLRVKEEEAIQRKEGVTMERIEKARTEDSILQAKERRDYQLSQRVQTVGAIIETKSKEASRRVESYLLQKQQRACRKEQKERAEQRRKLLWYERRAKLLKSLDGKLERAAQRSNEITNEKAIKAGEELARAKEVARKVKAARVIQEIARDVYAFKKCESVEIELSQHEAAARLQKWVAWRAAVCKRRLVANDVLDVDEVLELFRLPPKEKKQLDHCLSFEELTMQMRRPDIQQKATSIVDCLLPIIDIHFASSATSSSKGVDGRSLLTLFLIAIHPYEVLGDDFDGDDGDRCARGTKQLANAAAALLLSFSGLSAFSAPTLATADFENISCYHTKSSTLFNWWKQMDLEQLLAGLSKQLQQSWVIYIASSETLQYLTEVTGVDDTSESNAVQDDPLMQLRLRHKASQSGSRSHIKRIRQSLNKLIGSDEGREVVKDAKVVAKNEIAETKAVEVLKQEVDEMRGFEHGNDADYIESIMTPVLSSNDVAQDTAGDDKGAPSGDLPEEIAKNRNLIHSVLVTDAADFDKLSWDGVNSHLPEISPDQFMSTFLPATNSEDNNPANLPMRIAMNMKLAYFNGVAQEMSTENYVPVQGLLKELHDKMRTLLPNRQDLHSHINDDDIGYSSCTSDVIRVLFRSGYLLANYLESPSRAESTRELLGCLEAFNSRNRDGDGDGDSAPLTIPYEFETENLFAVASIAFILQKVELCQMDVSNYKFSHHLAPFIHQVGHEYERSHFRKTHGDYVAVPIKELQEMLPSTHAWVRNTVGLFESTDNITMQSNLEQKMDFIKGRGFVDGILFTKQELVLPELFSLDIEGINSIRNEARCCVIASALSLHACNKIGSSILQTEVGVAGNELMSVLRKKHFKRDDLEAEVIAALTSFTTALAERSLNEEECITLKNHALAVLRGNDPVLKLLDNRIRSYFRYACRWTPDTKSTGEISAPIEMKTGRKVVKGDDDFVARGGVASSKAEFSLAAHKEAKRLGFTFVSSDLIAAGNKARLIISLVCSNYDKDILGRLLMAEK